MLWRSVLTCLESVSLKGKTKLSFDVSSPCLFSVGVFLAKCISMFVCFSWYFQWKKPPRIFLAQKYILLQANRIASVTLPSHPHPTVLGCKLLCFAAPNSSLAIPKGILTDCDRCSWFSHLNNDFCIVGPSTFIRCFEYKTLPWIFVNGKTFGKSRFKKKDRLHICIYS